MNEEISLTWAEVLTAAYIGTMRNVQSLRGNWTPGADVGVDNSWTPNIEGAAGEMAVAKYLGMYWSGAVGDPQADDVGPFQVRTNASRKYDDLILRPRDKPERIYISVLSFLPQFTICGWIGGAEGKQEKWLRDGTAGRPPCFFVPRTSLKPMSLLPRRGA